MVDQPNIGEMFEIPDSDIPPTIEQPSGEAPKRRGRPPGSKNSTTRASTSDRSPRRGSRTWIREQCSMLVGLGNLAISLSPAKEDCLSDREMNLLTDALVAEASASERILKWMTVAAGVSPHILLIQAAVTIAVPRLQRRGILPTPELTPEQVAELERMANEQGFEFTAPNARTNAPTVPVGAGPTPLNNWRNGFGENNAG